ncbi:oligosaccharide MFS transporter [Enterococcus hulanensis]|uniref:oligosaccharide MFS transporter n=1 Tax=Enterococcus hulanensis TaxID=2559929 RepID=UPI001A92C102|nr:oligosaccharide MFS transporter [Enterococcus hulanensis]MBO0410819.1 oligosaccharide MFS transporter [Enterococcus hulanensis]
MTINKNVNSKRKSFWSFAGTHFSYFFSWAVIYGYLTLWLEQVADLGGTEAGLVFSLMAGISLIFQPIFGILSDKLKFKKTLLACIALSALFIGPFFQWLLLPLLNINLYLGIAITGLYLSFVLNGGVGVVEQYIERASWVNNFEYGHSRMGGSLAGITATLVAGRLFVWNPTAIFWACSIAAAILSILIIFFDKVEVSEVVEEVDQEETKLDKKTICSIFKQKNFWALALFYIGAAAIYDVFDQQFIVYFKSFFETANTGTIVYSYMASAQVGLELLLMIPMPYIINKIGAKRGLIIFGFITFIRIFGSAVAPNYQLLIVFRIMAGLEMPLLLVSIMKYIANTFDRRLYATIYMLGSNFAKQVSVFIFSTVSGRLYDSIGFHQTYLLLAGIVFVITIISAFTLKNDHKEEKENTATADVI